MDFAVSQLHTGKAAGLDLLQAEHLTNSHPSLYKILSLLYNFSMKIGFVPDKFGQSLLIPIPKILVLVAYSKLVNFEALLLVLYYPKYLNTVS